MHYLARAATHKLTYLLKTDKSFEILQRMITKKFKSFNCQLVQRKRRDSKSSLASELINKVHPDTLN